MTRYVRVSTDHAVVGCAVAKLRAKVSRRLKLSVLHDILYRLHHFQLHYLEQASDQLTHLHDFMHALGREQKARCCLYLGR